MKILIVGAALALFIGLPTLAESADQTDEKIVLERIIEAVRQGWLSADGSPFREHFHDFEGARYIESGGQNEGLDDLVEHHVEPEADALGDFELEFSNIETHIGEDFAWALVDTKIQAVVKRDGRVIDNKGFQTFLFQRFRGEWKVIHTHSSSRQVRPPKSDGGS